MIFAEKVKVLEKIKKKLIFSVAFPLKLSYYKGL